MSRVSALPPSSARRKVPAERILVVAHNHPAFHAGGSEILAYDLFRAYRTLGRTAFFLGAANHPHREAHPGTSIQAMDGTDGEFILHSKRFDTFSLAQVDLYGDVAEFRRLLTDLRPTVIHFHHVLLLGLEALAVARFTLPEAQIVLTVHDYYLMCAHDGLMARTHDRRPCERASPDRCHACFPNIRQADFLLRELTIRSHLPLVDRFVAPSRLMARRLAEWGIAEHRIVHLPNAVTTGTAARPRSTGGRRAVFGYFGNFNPWKGIEVLLDAARLIEQDGEPVSFRIHGSAPFQRAEFVERLDGKFRSVERSVVRLGAYDRAELGALMAAVDWVVVPSIWWENAPLVIQEAFAHGRPVIASRLGGMAEAVRDGVDGLLVEPGEPRALAAAIRTAAGDPALWERLAAGITPPAGLEACARAHLALYSGLAEDRLRAAASTGASA